MAVLALVLVLGFVGYACYRGLQQFYREDKITGTYGALVTAIHAYEKRTGAVPPTLDALTPEYIPKIPSIPEIEKVEYTVSESGKGCALWLYPHGGPRFRVYLCVIGRELNSEEEARKIGYVHGFDVLRKEGSPAD